MTWYILGGFILIALAAAVAWLMIAAIIRSAKR